MGSVHEFIVNNWQYTIRKNDKIPYPFTTPCADDLFVNFFYWDTYFTNLGLLRDGLEEQALNNLKVMAYFLNTLGYIPNADHLLYRSQPPLFTRSIYDYVKYTGDESVIEQFKKPMEIEFAFFKKNRLTPIGLYAYSSEEPKEGLDWYYQEFSRRLGGFNEEEKKVDKDVFSRGLLAIAESGWDFNVRFTSGNIRFAPYEFAHIDLNCLLYDAFNKASELFLMVGDKEEADRLKEEADNLKDLINKYLLNPKDGLYYDYNFVKKEYSSILSAASFYPYALGISDDKVGALKVFNTLNLKYGISVAPFRGEEEVYFQWDYPALWPSNSYFAFEALNNVGLNKYANIVRDKYLNIVNNVFKKTGKLWEKYDASNGEVSITKEYQTPTMMGWTAGVYEYFLNKK